MGILHHICPLPHDPFPLPGGLSTDPHPLHVIIECPLDEW